MKQRSRGAKRPGFAVSLTLSCEESAGKAGCRLAPTIRCAQVFAHANAQADNRWAGKHPAFPARWVDGLCALSPEPSSFWPPSPRELAMLRDPVGPRPISARLDRSNDGQDDALSPYAASGFAKRLRQMLAPSVRTLLDLTRFISPWSRLACPTQPRPPHPHPRSLRRTIAPLLGPGCATDTAIPNFGKAEYFCGRGLTGAARSGVFCPTGETRCGRRQLAVAPLRKLRSHGTLTPHFLVIVFSLAACPGGHDGMVRPPVWKDVGADDPFLCEISAKIKSTDRS